MFTIETEFDYTKVTVMDEHTGKEDMIVRFGDNGIYLSQWSETLNQHHTIWITEQMLQEFLYSLDSQDGTFIAR